MHAGSLSLSLSLFLAFPLSLLALYGRSPQRGPMINYHTLRISELTRVGNLNILPRVFHSHGSLTLLVALLAPLLQAFGNPCLPEDCAHTISPWFDLSSDLSRVCEFAETHYYGFIDSRDIDGSKRRISDMPYPTDCTMFRDVAKCTKNFTLIR